VSARVDSVVPLDSSALEFGSKITAAWQKSVEGILEAGKLLIQAKAVLPGEFERMVKQQCPFGIRTAQRLMQIAANPALSDATHVSCLPSSWGTLAELAKFEPAELSHAIGNHWIKPETKREDVAPLRQRVQRALGRSGRSRTERKPFAKPTEKEIAGRITKMVTATFKTRFLESPLTESDLEYVSDNITKYVDVMVTALEQDIQARGREALRFFDQLVERPSVEAA